jgi:hypothetical protein
LEQELHTVTNNTTQLPLANLAASLIKALDQLPLVNMQEDMVKINTV